MLEQFRLGQRPLDAFLEPLLDLFQTTYLVPRDLGDLEIDFAQSARLDILDSLTEVRHGDLHLLEHLGRNLLLVEVNLREVSAQGLHRRLADQSRDVGADEAVRVIEQPVDVEVVANRHATGVDIDDLFAAVLVGHADLQLTIKAAGSAQSRIDGVTAVGCADHDDVVASLHAIEKSQELGYHPALDLTGDVLALGRDTVELVNEDDRWGVGGGLVENLAELLLALPVVLRDNLRAVDRSEVGFGFVGDRLGDQGLAGPGWAMEQYAPRRVDSETPEQDGVLQREFNHLTNLLQLLPNAADVLVGDGLDLPGFFLVYGILLDDDLSVRQDLDDAFRIGRDDCEREGLGEQSHAGDEDAVTGDHWSLVEAASGEALDARSEADLLLLRHHRAEHQTLARLGLDLGDGDAVTEAHACVFSDYSVNSDNS